MRYFFWTWHCQHALVHIPSHAIRVQHVYFSEYLLIKNYMAVKSIHQFFAITVSI